MSTQKWVQFSSVQSLSRVRLCDSMNCSTPGLHQSPTPRVHSNSCPSSLWCHPAISSSVIPFSSCPQSLPASDSFPMTGVSSLASFLPKNTQGWSPLFNLFFFYFLIKFLFLLYFTLQYCIGFAIHWHWWKKSKRTPIDGEIYHVRGLEESMRLNCGVGEDSWESLGLQGDPTSPFWRRSALGFLWKEWC